MEPPQKSLLLSLFTVLCTTAVLSKPPAAQAQTAPASAPSTSPAYDVMTIKLNKSLGGNLDIDSGNGRFSATNVSLKNLLEGIYEIDQNLIFGLPGPLESARFDIEAKVSDLDGDSLKEISPEQERKMILPLLTDRFQLKTHIETKTLPVFELVVLPGGPKFKPSADQAKAGDGGIGVHSTRTGATLTANDIPMSSLAKSLAGPARRTIIDKTHLTGKYDLTLQWSNDNNPDATAEQSPSIFTALPEQLGLKLQPAKGPIETLVVDHAELPSDN